MKDRALKIINLAVLFQQQRYLVAISFLFYLANGLTLSDFLLFQSIFYFTGLIAEIPAGYIGDIFPRKNVLIFSYVLYMCRIAMWIIMPNYYTILLGEICYGLSKAFYRGVSDGYIYDYLKENSITKLMSDKYGKFNFFMSTGSAISCLIGAWLFKFVGFGILLGIEFLFNSFAVFILFFLPNVPHTGRNLSFGKHIKNIFDIVISAMKNPKLNIYLFYGGILTGVTSIFVWNFQPFMKSFALPVYLFGVIYFINHMLRAFGSAGADKVLQKIPLKKVSCFVWLFYLLCFLLMIRVQGMSGYFVCIATQMPRDIPLATLSQMGTFIVHRLINDYDKKAVEDAASAANRNILSFLPILGEGEAVLVGVDFPMPLTVKIKEPQKKPNSKTPRLEKRN